MKGSEPEIEALARRLLDACRKRGVRIATAESCTGGLVSAALTELPGSSEVFERGFVAYSNDAKIDLLGVPDGLIEAHGAVSDEVARAMAEGALARSDADLAVAVTGIAGPGGGTAAKPVGLVHLATSRKGSDTRSERLMLNDVGRQAIRSESVRRALELMLSNL